MTIALIIYASLVAMSWVVLDDLPGIHRVWRAIVQPVVCAVLLAVLVAVGFLSIPRWIA